MEYGEGVVEDGRSLRCDPGARPLVSSQTYYGLTIEEYSVFQKMKKVAATTLVMISVLAATAAFAAPSASAAHPDEDRTAGPAILGADTANGEITFYWEDGSGQHEVWLFQAGRAEPVAKVDTWSGQHTFTNLRRDAVYMAMVRGDNQRFGPAGFAAAGYVPTGVTATATEGTIALEWDDMNATDYQVNVHRSDNSVATVRVVKGQGVEIDGLTNGMTYSTSVRAKRDGRWSQWSPRVAATPSWGMSEAIELADPSAGDDCNHYSDGADVGFDFTTRIWKGASSVDDVRVSIVANGNATTVDGVLDDGVWTHALNAEASAGFIQPPTYGFDVHTFVTDVLVDGEIVAQKVERWHYWAPGQGDRPASYEYMPLSPCQDSTNHNCRAGHR